MAILIVDEDIRTRQYLHSRLVDFGYHVVAVSDGHEALRLTSQSRPELIVSDELLPTIDGFELCRRVKTDPRLQSVPFFFFTRSDTTETNRRLAKSVGAEKFLSKARDRYELLTAIRAYVRSPAELPVPEPVESRRPQSEMDPVSLQLLAANNALSNAQERFRQLVDNLSDGFWLMDVGDRRLVYRSGTHHEIIPTKRDQPWWTSVHPLDYERVVQDFLVRARAGSTQIEYRVVRADGSIRWIRDRAFPITDGRQRVLQIAGITKDVTEQRELSQRIVFQATFDALTGLVNRATFESRLQRALGTSAEQLREHALCYMDLDQFKLVNDTCGHAAGDELLKQLAKLLPPLVRKRDTFARLGADEFALLIEDCSLHGAYRVAESVRKAIEGFRFQWENQNFNLTVSIGVVPITEAHTEMAEVLSAADSACYLAKEQGRNRIYLDLPDDDGLSIRYGEMRWVNRLGNAIDQNDLRLYRQKIIPLKPIGSSLGHVELLLRLQEADGTLVSPGTFLPPAERYHVATRIDRWVVEHAVQWLSKVEHEFEMCSINLSGRSLGDQEFLEFIVGQLELRPSLPTKVCFEITETAAIANLAAAERFIDVLRQLGCKFALDDFGSGQSSFAYLKSLSMDFLKIDGLFVRGVVNDPVDLAMVKSINEVGHALGKQTIAEFVENRAIRDRLCELGVDYAQGFEIGMPRPI